MGQPTSEDLTRARADAPRYFPTLILPPTSVEDLEAAPEAFLREHHSMMTTSDYQYMSKGARRIRGMSTVAPTFTMLKTLYAADAQTRLDNRGSNSILTRIASWLLKELIECVELRDSSEENGRALAQTRFTGLAGNERMGAPQVRNLKNALSVLTPFFDGQWRWDYGAILSLRA